MADIGQWLRNSGVVSRDSLKFITSIRYDASLMKALNNMTFFYDANWQGEENTLPMAFFYVKSYGEIMSSEVSQKSMLFYNSGSTTPDSTKGGLLGVVADNIVNKPKKYKLEVLVPASFVQIDKIYQFDSYSRNILLMQQFKNTDDNNVPYMLSAMSSITTNVVASLVNALVAALSIEDLVSPSIITDILSMNTANKDSLSAMWGNRTILKMKLPNGWKFKYVAIENMNIDRRGEDGDFFTGTIEVTELPILTIDRERKFVPLGNKKGLLKRVGVGTFEGLINRMEKAFS